MACIMCLTVNPLITFKFRALKGPKKKLCFTVAQNVLPMAGQLCAYKL